MHKKINITIVRNNIPYYWTEMTIGRYVSCLVGLVPLVGAASAAAALLAPLVSSCKHRHSSSSRTSSYLKKDLVNVNV